ncbi:MAG TPA: hypothetical protein VEL48_12025 [Candidatus Acidoferrales bacterium]|nr:hypothetical protein [Candidatus Acidoferrales bacterium]
MAKNASGLISRVDCFIVGRDRRVFSGPGSPRATRRREVSTVAKGMGMKKEKKKPKKKK